MVEKPPVSAHQHISTRGWDEATDAEVMQLDKAVMLSGGNLAICEALLRGEHVPIDKLDPVYVAKYGMRP